MNAITYETIRHTTVKTSRPAKPPAKARKAAPAVSTAPAANAKPLDPNFAVFEIVREGDATLFDALLPRKLQALLRSLCDAHNAALAGEAAAVFELCGKPAERNGVLITLPPVLAALFAELCETHNETLKS